MNKFTVSKLIMVETSRYPDMYLRPYESNYDYQTQQALNHSTESGSKLTANALTSVASMILKPSAVPVGVVGMVNGFSEKRFSFMLEITEYNTRITTGGVRYVITGYTDQLGVINDRRGNPILDPNMSFYINNIHTIRDTLVNTAIGKSYRSNMASSLQLPHVSTSNRDGFGFSNTPTYLMRPEDVAGKISTENDPTRKYLNESSGVIDLGGVLTGVVGSKRGNTSRSHYLSDLFTGYVNALTDTSDFEYDDVWDKTKQNVRGNALSNNPFIAELMMTTDFAAVGSFTLSELDNMTGNAASDLADVIIKNNLSNANAGRLGMFDSTDSDDWGMASTTSQAATILQQSIGSIMSDCMLTTVGFIVHNNTLTGEMDFRFTSPINSFTDGIDLTPLLENMFKPRVMAEIIDDISFNNQVSFSLECVMDLHYESTISISIDGEEGFYVAPSFCDGITTPVLTYDNVSLSNLAEDVVSMVGSIGPSGAAQEFIQDHMSQQRRVNTRTSNLEIYIPDSI